MSADQKRRNYFIEKRFQFNFILKFCALVAVGGVLTIAILYYLALRSTTVSIVDSRVLVKTTADFLLPVLIQTVVVVMILVSIATVFVTLFVSHKIAGPLYRLKKKMREIEEGDFSGDFRIRHLDQLQDLAQSFNSMIHKIRQEVGLLKQYVVTMKDKIEGISEHDIPDKDKAALSDLKNISAELKKIISYFKT